MFWFCTSIFGIIPLAIYAVYKYYTGNKSYWPSRGVPLVNISDVAPLMDRMLFRQPLHEIEQNTYDFVKKKHSEAPYVGIMESRNPSLILMDLDLIKSVLVKDFDHFVDRRSFNLKKGDPIMSEMLLSLHGQEWKNMRNTLSPTFSTGKIRRMFEIINETGDKMTTFLNEELATNNEKEIELRDLCSKYTMDVIANSAFGVDSRTFKDSDAPFEKMGKRVQNQFSTVWGFIKILIFILAPKLLNTFRISLMDKEATTFFSDVIKTSVEHRRKTGTKREDFLQLLIDTQSGELKAEDDDKTEVDVINEKNADLQKATKVHLTDLSLIAQSLLFFLGGFDTTETMLVLATYELAVNSDVQQRLYEEINEALLKNNGKWSYEMLNALPYLEMVVAETLRKYPPGFRLERKCTKEYTLPGTKLIIKKDQIVVIPVMGIHHNEEYYPNPEKFDPERFSPENKSSRHPYTYMPFGQGPRSCIAMRFALIEGKAAIAHLIHKFTLEPCSKTHIPMKFATKLVLKPEGGLWLNIKSRN